MTNLRKCVGFSTFAILALAFVCLIIGQAAIAKIEKATVNPNADNSFETAVPLPTLNRGPAGSQSSIGDLAETNGVVTESSVEEGLDMRKMRNVRPDADGSTKAAGDNPGEAFVIGDETALPFTGFGDVSTGTHAGDAGLCLYGLDLCANGYPCAPDQWWALTPTTDIRIDVTIGNGTYDGDDDYAMMLTDGDATTYVTCADPAAGTMPSFVNVQLTGGHTYYIMVEALWGIGASGGAYQIDVSEYVPHPDFVTAMCADPGAQHETEVCGTRTNAGCYGNYNDATGGFDVDIATAEQVLGDPTAAILCGTLDLTPEIVSHPDGPDYPTNGAHRDADQWHFTITEPTSLTLEIGAEIQGRLFMHTYDGGCASQDSKGVIDFNQGTIVTGGFILEPGDYGFSIRANNQLMRCGEGDYGDARYYIKTGFIPLIPFDDCPVALEISGDDPLDMPIIQDMCGLNGDGAIATEYGAYYMEQNGWFLWTCEESGEYTFSTCTTPNLDPGVESYDLFMAVWSNGTVGCGDAWFNNQIAGNDDGCYPTTGGYESEVTFIAAEGLEYLISVGAWGWNSTCGDLYLEISHAPIPLLGDDCATEAQPITADGYDVFFNNLAATEDGPEPSYCASGSFGGDVWFLMTAWETGICFAEFCNANFDVNMEVYEGNVCPTDDTFIPLRCNDDGCWQDYSDYHGSYTSFPVTSGNEYLIRIGGWFRIPDYPLEAYGMGFGWYNLFITTDPASIVPVNDVCSDVTPTTLADGVFEQFLGNMDYATRNDCEDFDALRPHNVWEAFSVPSGVCMDVSVDFFSTVDPYDDGSRYGSEAGDGQAWNGCPCTGDFVEIIATLSCLNGIDCAIPAATWPLADFNNFHMFEMMPAGDYWVVINFAAVGLHTWWGDYTCNIMGQVITCAYCNATANPAACPPVAGASWIEAVRLEEINNYEADAGIACGAYTDNTDQTATLYKGLPYTLEFDMNKVGLPTYELDAAAVFVDWDQNAVFFNLGEQIEPTRLAYTWTAELTAPVDAPGDGEGASGETRLRLRLGNTADGVLAYCGGVTWGEVEDYKLLLVDLECGDFDMNGLDAGDIAFLQAYYFGGGAAPDYWQRADIDGDGMITLADIVALVDALYHGGDLNCL